MTLTSKSFGGEKERRGDGEMEPSSPHLALHEVCALSIREAAQFFEELELNATERLIATEVLKEIRGRLGFLLRCGLDYLTLDRAAPTLSGVRRNAFAWPGRSAVGWSASFTSSTSRRSDCIRETTRCCSTVCASARSREHGHRRRAR